MRPLLDLSAVVVDSHEAGPVGEFYRQALGGNVLGRDHDSVTLRISGVTVIFREVPDFRPPSWPGSAVPLQVHLDVEVDDVAETEAALHRLGATTPAYQAHRDDGLVVMRDPAGHLFCIGTRLPPTPEGGEPEDGPEHRTPFAFGVHHVQLSIPAGSEEACRRFYVGVLGLAEVPKPPVLAARGGLWVRGDGIELHLGVEEDFRPALEAHPGIRVRGLDDLARRLAEHGVRVRPDDALPGHRRFHADDPVGNRLEFIEPDV
jgi:catechol 2,3-dioxygenase-like lactoylglutathione lyase family enzyme